MQLQSLVVELVGPAGAGKTTLMRALSQHDRRIREGVQLSRLAYILHFASIVILLLPTLVHRCGKSRYFTREEIRGMVYLKAWRHVLAQARNSDTVTILDHGPIFRLAWLREFSPELGKNSIFEKWWDTTLNQWASTLDIVIWLDAPDPILFERIQTRERWHLVKMKSEQEAYQFLCRCRIAFGQVISGMTVNGGPRVLRFDTNQALEQIVNQVMAAIEDIRAC